MNKGLLRTVLRTTSPVFFGYLALGIAFGMVTVNSGYEWWLAPLTGLFNSSNIIWVSICTGLGIMLLIKGPVFWRKENV
jgi:predicted branched-subunit amino acid permease